MKALFYFLFASFLFGPFAYGVETMKPKSADVNYTNISVKGMFCSHCSEELSSAFMKNKNVKNITADHKTGEVKIEWKDPKKPLAEEKIMALVSSVGFEMDQKKAKGKAGKPKLKN